jgi:hypothetical protein
MTTLTLTANYCGKTLNSIVNGFKYALRSIIVGYMLGRQASTNRWIAQHLIHEYPEHTVESLTYMLNQKTLKDIDRYYK